MQRRQVLGAGAAALTGATVGNDAPAQRIAGDRRARGLATLRRVTGGSGQAVVDGLADIAPELAGFIVDFAYAEVIARDGIDLKTRELCTVASLAALGNAAPQLKVHLRGALNVGASRAEIVEVLLQTAVYAGFPAALNAIAVARDAFREAGN